MLSKEEKEVIQQIGSYKYNQMKEKGFNYQEYLKYLQQKEQEKQLRKQMGNYEYRKMKELGLNYEQYLQYKEEKKKEKILKKKIGYRKYAEIEELGMTLDEYEEFHRKTKYKNRQKYEEKNKIRYRTIRYIERYCNLEMKCQLCGEKAEIHHPNYNDYLKINLLCKRHHTALHNFELIPPEIIDLEKNTVKKQIQKEKQNYIDKNIENIKNDIIKNLFSYSELENKYQISSGTIKKHLEKEKDWSFLQQKLKETGKKKNSFNKLKHRDNPIQKYRIENNLTVKQLSSITQIPEPTIRKMECEMEYLSKIKPCTKEKLKSINLIY